MFNIRERTRKRIDTLVNNSDMYSSRSELVRSAIREHLRSILELFSIPPRSDRKIVRIPTTEKDEQGNLITSYQTYKVVRRLESAP